MAVVANDDRIAIASSASDVTIHDVQQHHRNGTTNNIHPFAAYHSIHHQHHHQPVPSIASSLDVDLDQNHHHQQHHAQDMQQRILNLNQVQNLNTNNNVSINQNQDQVNNNTGDDVSIDQTRQSLTIGQIYHQSSSSSKESSAVHTLMNLGDHSQSSSKGTELRLLTDRLHHTPVTTTATATTSPHQNRQYSTMNKNLPLKKIKVDFSRFVQPESADLAVSSHCDDDIIDNVSCTSQVPSTRVDSNLISHMNPTQILIVANNGSQQQEQQEQQQNTGYLSSEFNSQMHQQQVNSSLRLNLNNNNPSDSDRIHAQVSNHYNEKNIALNFSHDLAQPTVAHQVHQAQINQHHLLHQDTTTRLLCENGQFNGVTLPVAGNSWRTSHEAQSPMKHTDIVYQNGCSTSSSQIGPTQSWNHHDTSNQPSLIDQANCYRQNRTTNIPSNQFSSSRTNMTSSDHQNVFSYNAVHHQLTAGHMGYRSLSHQVHHQPHTNMTPHSSTTNNHLYDSKSIIRSQTTAPSLSDHQSSVLPINSTQTTAFHSNSQSSSSINQPSTSKATTVNQKPQSFECITCGKILPSRSLYQIHLKSHSQDQGSKSKFSCQICGHSFSQKTSLNRHMKSHTGERPFPCEICAKSFSEKERLKIHMRTHTGEKPFSCHVCGKSFSQKSTVKRHQTVHTGEKKFRCDCGKGFANRGNLIAHIKTRGANHSE